MGGVVLNIRVPDRRARGFSLIEILIVVALIGLVGAFLLPQLLAWAHQQRLNGTARQTSMMMQKARLEAIRRNVPVIVQVDFELDQIRAFADLNDDAGDPVSDLVFNPVDDAPVGTTDYPVAPTIQLPGDVVFIGDGETEAEGAGAVDGFTVLAAEVPNGAVFQPGGSVRARGAFRIGDFAGNVIEIRVSPEATGRVQIRKFDPDRAENLDGSHYYQPSSEDMETSENERWVWY